MNKLINDQLRELREKMFPRPCARKQRYLSKSDAESVRALRQPKEVNTLRSYECPHCNGWHLTKQEPAATIDDFKVLK